MAYRATECHTKTGGWSWCLEVETEDGPGFLADFYRNEEAAKECAAALNSAAALCVRAEALVAGLGRIEALVELCGQNPSAGPSPLIREIGQVAAALLGRKEGEGDEGY